MKSKYSLPWLLTIILAIGLQIQAQSAQAAPELTIGNYQLVSSKRITRTVFEYTYKASMTNAARGNAKAALATLRVNASGITVLDNKLDFGDVQSNATVTSKDTFIIRQDRKNSFSVNDLQWETHASNLSFSTHPDPEKVIADLEGGVYPVNQVLINLIDSATRDDAEEIANNVGGKIIGYFPSTNMYQLEVSSNSVTQLKTIVVTLNLDPRIEATLTNSAIEFYSIKTDIGNLRLTDPNKTVAYDNIKIDGAWEVIAGSNIKLTPIKVGIVDTGIDINHPEFKFNDETLDTGGIGIDEGGSKLVCLNGTQTIRHSSSHGTQVAGVIGANNLATFSNYEYPQMNGILSGNPELKYNSLTGKPLV